MLRNDTNSFNDGNVAIDRQIGERLYEGAWSGPANLKLVDFGVQANAKHHARVMTGEKASAARFESGAFQGSGLPGYAGAYGVDVSLPPHEFDTQPVVAFGCLIS